MATAPDKNKLLGWPPQWGHFFFLGTFLRCMVVSGGMRFFKSFAAGLSQPDTRVLKFLLEVWPCLIVSL